MNQILDPITGEKLILYASKGESDEVWEPDVTRVIIILARHYMCSEIEAMNMLANSDIDNPVVFNDEVFWVE